jgi:hypothetical protein
VLPPFIFSANWGTRGVREEVADWGKERRRRGLEEKQRRLVGGTGRRWLIGSRFSPGFYT